MGIMSSVERAALRADVSWTPLDDRWYASVASGAASEAGVRVSPQTAMKSSAVFACMNIIGRTIASLRPSVYRRLPNDDREPAKDHWSYPLMWRPNRWQTTFDYLYLRTMYLLGRGNDVDRLYFDPRTGAVTDLWPLLPDCIHAERGPAGTLRYQVQEPGRALYTLLQDEVVHVRDYAPDGIWGLSRIQLGAQGIGLGLATEAFRSRFFRNNAQPGLVLEHPKVLSPKAKTELEDSVSRATSGRSQFRPWVAEEGMKVVQLPISAKDSQLIESAAFQVADVARWFGVPLYMIGLEEKSTSWGSGIEEQKNGFVTFTIGPFLELYTQAFNAALFGDDDEYFVEFGLKTLLRGNMLARYQAHAISTAPGTGWATRNEVRREENLNAGPPELDEFLDPLNSGPSGGRSDAPPSGSAPGEDGAAAFAILAADAGERIASREARGLEHRPKAVADVPERFAAWADGYFAEHGDYVERTLGPLAAAWARQTGAAVPVALTAREVVARGRQASEPCPAGDELEAWRIRRASQVAEIIEAALTPRTPRRAA